MGSWGQTPENWRNWHFKRDKKASCAITDSATHSKPGLLWRHMRKLRRHYRALPKVITWNVFLCEIETSGPLKASWRILKIHQIQDFWGMLAILKGYRNLTNQEDRWIFQLSEPLLERFLTLWPQLQEPAVSTDHSYWNHSKPTQDQTI